MQNKAITKLIQHMKKDFENAKKEGENIVVFLHRRNNINKVLSKTEKLKYGLEKPKNTIQKTIMSEPYTITNKKIKWIDFKDLLTDLLSNNIYIEKIKPGQ